MTGGEGDPLSLGDLYERLLRAFAHREIVKHAGHLDPDGIDAAVDRELRRLSIVAFAMFNLAGEYEQRRVNAALSAARQGLDEYMRELARPVRGKSPLTS